MNDIQIFNNPEFGNIRTVTVDGEPWFVGNDCAKALGYKNLYNGITKNVDKEDRRVSPVGSTSGIQRTTIINESGLYALIFGSKLESAKKFKSWVTKEILPTIRKTGSYSVPKPTRLDRIALDAYCKEVNEKYDAMAQRINSMQTEFNQFKDGITLLGVEESQITKAIKNKVDEYLGPSTFPSYTDKSLRTKLNADLHGQLKREFGVTTYKKIKHGQIRLALDFIERYRPPMHLRQAIDSTNNSCRAKLLH